MSPSRLPLLIALAVVCFGPLGCSDGSFRVGVETHSTRFEAMPSPESILAGEPRSCLVLPASGPDRHSPVVNVALSIALRERLPKVTAIPAARVASLVNAHGLHSTVDAMIKGYATAGLLDPAGLAKLHEEFKIDFVLLPTLVLVDRNEQTRLGFLGVNLLYSSWTRVQVVLQLWRAEDGALVWQSIGGGSLDAETPSGVPASLLDTVTEVFVVMVDDFMLGRSGGVTATELPAKRPDRPEAGVPEDVDPPPSPADEGSRATNRRDVLPIARTS